ncbi:MAG: hypothetical protein BGO90_00535 [Legionella sp. 40-6]|nr:hypothetical protein [Legionella sp.]OJY46413.1 MAG: hypothetical protein BGO90_00535 [Legionella sp. 40-6]
MKEENLQESELLITVEENKQQNGSSFGNPLDEKAEALFVKVKRNPLVALIVATSIGYIMAKIVD